MDDLTVALWLVESRHGVCCETKLTAPLTRNFQNAGLMVYDDDDNYLKLGVLAVNEPGAARDLAIEMGTEVDGTAQFPFVNDQDGVPDDNDEWWLRLTKAGDTYSAQWSVDGETWTALSATRDIELADPAVGLYATGSGAQGEDEEVTVSFDYFRFVADEGDTTAPTVIADVAGNGTQEVTLTLTVDDGDGSGVASVEYRVDGGDWAAYDDTVTFTEPGDYTVEFRATDVDGNVSDVQSVTFTVAASPADACPDGDSPDGTVVIGDTDTGIPNVDTGNGCTIDDLIDDESSWSNRGQFVRHVNAVLRQLHGDGLIDARDRAAIIRAAARMRTPARGRR